MIGTSPVFEELRRGLSAVADRRCTVLIGGETGTGKELVARNIHAHSPRASGPFVPVDCAALPEALIESQMFGHVRGAFTDAQQNTLGFIRSADGGTLFLDEIGELPASAQAKLLRCLQERQVVPVGTAKPIGVDIRVIAATHRDLLAMVGTGAFREDLYYRLNVATLTTPPLRERPEDIGLLAHHFVNDLAELYEESPKAIDPGAIKAMASYAWPGNIRELCNAVEHAFILCTGPVIFTSDLPKVIAQARPTKQLEPAIMPLAQTERELISRALAATNGNQTKAARLIGVERHRLHRMVVRHGLEALTHPRPN
jgi:DNA-binding NtrC family response regulator